MNIKRKFQMPSESSSGPASLDNNFQTTQTERVTLTVSLFALLFVWVTSVFFLTYTTQNQERNYQNILFEEVQQRTDLLALMQSELLDTQLRQYDRTLLTLRDRYLDMNDPATEMAPLLRSALLRQASISDLLILGTEGDVITWTQSGPTPNVYDRDYFRAHLNTQSDQVFLSLPAQSRTEDATLFIAVSRPILDDQGEWLGVIAAAVHLESLAENLGAFAIHDDITATVSHANGHLIMQIPFEPQEWGTFVDPPEIPVGNPIANAKSGEPAIVSARQLLPQWELAVDVNETAREAQLRMQSFQQAQRRQHLIVGLGLTILLTLMAWLLYRRLQAITTIRAGADELRASYLRNQAIVRALPDLLVTVSEDGKILDFESGEASLAILAPDNYLGRTLHETLPNALADKALQYVTHTLETHRVQTFEFQLDRNRQAHYFEARTSRLDGNRVLMIILDISQRISAQNELQWRATHDSLTGLPNRVLFYDRMSQSIARRMRERQSFALLYLDLNGFKRVNDTLGHTAGDELLQQIARRLKNRVRGTDTVARLAGDEFAIIFNNCSRHIAEKLAQEVSLDIAREYRLDGQLASLTTSIGIAICPEDGVDADTLVKVADSAMYQNKKLGETTKT